MGYVGSILARLHVVKVGKAELGCKLEGILDFCQDSSGHLLMALNQFERNIIRLAKLF